MCITPSPDSIGYGGVAKMHFTNVSGRSVFLVFVRLPEGRKATVCWMCSKHSKALGDSQHVRIPPAAHTYQSDVETVHRLEEDEFFDLEDFSSRGDFLVKAHTYQLYFNLVRPNSHKENQSPRQIIERLAPRLQLQLCLLPPVFPDYYLNGSGDTMCQRDDGHAAPKSVRQRRFWHSSGTPNYFALYSPLPYTYNSLRAAP